MMTDQDQALVPMLAQLKHRDMTFLHNVLAWQPPWRQAMQAIMGGADRQGNAFPSAHSRHGASQSRPSAPRPICTF